MHTHGEANIELFILGKYIVLTGHLPWKSKRLWKMKKITSCFDKCAIVTFFYFNKNNFKKKANWCELSGPK